MKNLLIIFLGLALPLSALADDNETVEQQIRSMEATFNNAYGENDLDTYFGTYAEDATLIFYGSRHVVADYEEDWHAMVAAGGGVEKNLMSDLRIQVMPGGEVAVATYMLESVSRSPNGDKSMARAFETDVWQKLDGSWKIVSMHYSEISPTE